MRLKSARSKSGETIELGDFTVLVGPNNVGKSQTLRDVHDRAHEPNTARPVILEELEFEAPDSDELLLDGLYVVDDPRSVGGRVARGLSSNLVSGHEVRFNPEHLHMYFTEPERLGPDWLLHNFGKFWVALLDAGSRLRVAESSSPFDPTESVPQRLMQDLFQDREAQEQFGAAFRDTFGFDARLDYSLLSKLHLRIAPRVP